MKRMSIACTILLLIGVLAGCGNSNLTSDAGTSQPDTQDKVETVSDADESTENAV